LIESSSRSVTLFRLYTENDNKKAAIISKALLKLKRP
jgi:hypothetical protein